MESSACCRGIFIVVLHNGLLFVVGKVLWILFINNMTGFIHMVTNFAVLRICHGVIRLCLHIIMYTRFHIKAYLDLLCIKPSKCV